MPRYDYHCIHCGKIEDVFARISEDAIACPKCITGTALRLFSPPTSIICDIEPYFDVNLGKEGGTYVTSRQHKNRLLKAEGLEIKG